MFAAAPNPPHTAVIFTSRRTTADEEEYVLVAQRMEELALAQPGYLGIESARDPHTRFGITVSYWQQRQLQDRGRSQSTLKRNDLARSGGTRATRFA